MSVILLLCCDWFLTNQQPIKAIPLLLGAGQNAAGWVKLVREETDDLAGERLVKHGIVRALSLIMEVHHAWIPLLSPTHQLYL